VIDVTTALDYFAAALAGAIGLGLLAHVTRVGR
jgi:hypothetical protein